MSAWLIGLSANGSSGAEAPVIAARTRDAALFSRRFAGGDWPAARGDPYPNRGRVCP